MKAVLLVIELKRDLQFCEDEISFLMTKMPARDILPVMRAPLHRALTPFQNYWFIGMSGEVLSMNGSFDPLASAIKQYTVPPVGRRERAQT